MRQSVLVFARSLIVPTTVVRHTVGIFMGTSMGNTADSIVVVGERDLLHIARVARSTWQNWVKKGLVSETSDGRYGEREVIRTAVAALVVSALDLPRAKLVLDAIGGSAEETCLRLKLDGDDLSDVVIDLHSFSAVLVSDATSLSAAVHAPVVTPRPYVLVPLAETARDARRVFRRLAAPRKALAGDGRRKRVAREVGRARQ